MTTALAKHDDVAAVTTEQIDLVRKTIAKDATPDELKLFLYDCQRQGVHPLDRLLHFTKRGGKYTPITSIDFMRTRAADTNEYAGSDDAVFSGEVGRIDFAAHVTVWRLVQGLRCGFGATARWAEYCPSSGQDHMWRKMPHTMLAKCAEALALRKGFPRQLAGLYAKEEMDQAGNGGYTVEPIHDAPVAQAASLPPMPHHPSEPNGGDSAASYQEPDAPHQFPEPPDGAVWIRKIDTANGKAKGFLHTHIPGEKGLAIYNEPLLTLASECCQNKIPVRLQLKSAASGVPYVIGLTKAVDESFSERHEAPLTADEIPF